MCYTSSSYPPCLCSTLTYKQCRLVVHFYVYVFSSPFLRVLLLIFFVSAFPKEVVVEVATHCSFCLLDYYYYYYYYYYKSVNNHFRNAFVNDIIFIFSNA